MPIGNLTSQIFANIYLNELDHFVKHELKIKSYLRYGDDFILISENPEKLRQCRKAVVQFLARVLELNLNPKNDKIIKVRYGLRFLGVVIWKKGRKLNKRALHRVMNRISRKNVSSYFGLIKKHNKPKQIIEFTWRFYRHLFPGN